ncbi:hypothetical protein SNK03_012765 [Fusarium graminearum]
MLILIKYHIRSIWHNILILRCSSIRTIRGLLIRTWHRRLINTCLLIWDLMLLGMLLSQDMLLTLGMSPKLHVANIQDMSLNKEMPLLSQAIFLKPDVANSQDVALDQQTLLLNQCLPLQPDLYLNQELLLSPGMSLKQAMPASLEMSLLNLLSLHRWVHPDGALLRHLHLSLLPLLRLVSLLLQPRYLSLLPRPLHPRLSHLPLRLSL